MILKVASPEVVSIEPYEETGVDGVYVAVDERKICLIERGTAYEITLE